MLAESFGSAIKATNLTSRRMLSKGVPVAYLRSTATNIYSQVQHPANATDDAHPQHQQQPRKYVELEQVWSHSGWCYLQRNPGHRCCIQLLWLNSNQNVGISDGPNGWPGFRDGKSDKRKKVWLSSAQADWHTPSYANNPLNKYTLRKLQQIPRLDNCTHTDL